MWATPANNAEKLKGSPSKDCNLGIRNPKESPKITFRMDQSEGFFGYGHLTAQAPVCPSRCQRRRAACPWQHLGFSWRSWRLAENRSHRRPTWRLQCALTLNHLPVTGTTPTHSTMPGACLQSQCPGSRTKCGRCPATSSANRRDEAKLPELPPQELSHVR